MDERKKTNHLKEKLLIVHADDAGLTSSQNQAIIELLRRGFITSYSIMVPCHNSQEIINFAKSNPYFDYGIHLTLTCEWNNLKFGPVLPPSKVPSLVDSNGFFLNTVSDLKKRAIIEDVKKELNAQIENVLDFGLTPSHLDSHMFALGSSQEFLEVYIKLSTKYKIPVLLNRNYIETSGLRVEQNLINKNIYDANVYMAHIGIEELSGLEDYYLSILNNLSSGINMIIIHPAYSSSELGLMTNETFYFGSEWREKDLRFFRSEKFQRILKSKSIELISFKNITS